MSLTQLITPKCKLSDLVLPEEVSALIQDLREDHEFADALTESGLLVRRKILLHGPSGCGKTSIAHALASEMGMKLHQVSLAETVGGVVGATEKQIDSFFTIAAQNRIVLLVDEFDSIGSARIDADSASALCANRSVNTILTCMETKQPLGLIVACTNFFDTIDPAIRRRFDVTIEVPPATRESLKKIAESILKGRFGLRAEDVLAVASTPAAVVQRAQDMLRRKVIASERSKRAETMPLFDEKDPPKTARNIRKKLEEAQAPATATV